MKNTVIEWLLVIFLGMNIFSFIVTGSVFSLIVTVLMLWLNWDFYVSLFYKIKYKLFGRF